MRPPIDNPAPPLVSVVMIFLDEERFIVEAIESVRAQSHDRWELLLVDDGSSDASAAIARGYAEREPWRIRYLEHPGRANRGMAASRNLGMREARGELLAFLDADDVWLPERLARHVELIAALPAPAVVIGADLYWHSWDPGHRAPDRVVTIGVTPGVRFDPPRLLALMLAPRLAASPGICSVTFHRLEVDGLSGAPDAFVGHYEDQCLYDALLAQRPALVTDEALARYRQHPGSFTARTAADGPEGAGNLAERRFLEWLRDHLAARGLLTGPLAVAMEARLAPHRAGATNDATDAGRGPLRAIARLAGGALRLLPAGAERAVRGAVEAAREAAWRRRVRRAERTGW